MVVARKTNYFFFSSRRRHTRLQGDWSSDVCSSDLYHYPQESVLPGMDARQTLAWHSWQGAAGGHPARISQKGGSGERRVGEEGRSRGGADHLKKKKRHTLHTGMRIIEDTLIVTTV